MSDANQTYQFQFLKTNGPISVVPVTPDEVKREALVVHILMGPTGSGKSAFIESLSPDQKLDISKDSLESVTQQVVCYKVLNLITGIRRTCILMDTPGFLDTKLSESRITRMIADKLASLSRSAPGVLVVFILYFQPITDIRLGGSKRDALKLLRAFADVFDATGVTVLTTMWNHISTTKQLQDAYSRFCSLKDEIYTSSDTLDMKVTRFQFSKH